MAASQRTQRMPNFMSNEGSALRPGAPNAFAATQGAMQTSCHGVPGKSCEEFSRSSGRWAAYTAAGSHAAAVLVTQSG